MSGSSVDDGVCEVGECEVQLLLYRQFWEELVEEDPKDCRTWGSSLLELHGRAAAHVLSGGSVRRRGGDLSLTLLIALGRGRSSLIVSRGNGRGGRTVAPEDRSKSINGSFFDGESGLVGIIEEIEPFDGDGEADVFFNDHLASAIIRGVPSSCPVASIVMVHVVLADVGDCCGMELLLADVAAKMVVDDGW